MHPDTVGLTCICHKGVPPELLLSLQSCSFPGSVIERGALIPERLSQWLSKRFHRLRAENEKYGKPWVLSLFQACTEPSGVAP